MSASDLAHEAAWLTAPAAAREPRHVDALMDKCRRVIEDISSSASRSPSSRPWAHRLPKDGRGAIVSGHMLSRRAFAAGSVHRILVLGMVVAGVVGPVVAEAQTPATDAQNPFLFELEEAQSPFRGRAVDGYV